ncbi:helix-turn-helix transcriptional regulator [Chromohalobacter canadensis]|uniref:helix-turn-helix transcriptional regulator n=1 Tax=Chromohalobacter canadensis TaxID=141389 RepID=UPI00241023BC|nr:AraC family transcriptional regulator [Chromohalobacter canadensis]
MRRLSASLVNRQAFEAPNWDQRSALLNGRMLLTELQPGMHLRLADVGDRYNLVTHAELPAGIKIALVIAGESRVSYNGQAATVGPASPSTGLLVRLPDATRFTRLGRAGGHERTLVLSLTPNWLSRHGYPAITGRQAQLIRWSPSPGLPKLAERLFEERFLHNRDAAHRLQLLGCALAMAGEALDSLKHEPKYEFKHGQEEKRHHETGDARGPKDRRLQRLRALIESGEAYHENQAELARRLGMSLSSLQRRFQAHYGESLGRFLRRRRLEIAHEALRNEGDSVEAAALQAGYTNAANFATAFKREFGIRPSDLHRTSPPGQEAGRATAVSIDSARS